ncbi:MAG: flagellar biosynthesis anti-sigma factor FlgM [Enterocloster citroniae]|nr:flagellar biosynthesis anti-sigma factor FlgM [Enterocloster citroniae]
MVSKVPGYERRFFIPILSQKENAMNIKLYAGNADYPDYRTLSPAVSKPALPADKAAGNYDKATFSRTQAPADDTDFAHILAREAAGSLKQGASQEKIMELQQQIASGTYKPNARRIAERILGYR